MGVIRRPRKYTDIVEWDPKKKKKKNLKKKKRVCMRACACLKRDRERVQGNAATPRMLN